MNAEFKSMIENIYKRAEDAARKPVPGEKGKPAKNDPDAEVYFYKAPKNPKNRKKVYTQVKEGLADALGKTSPESIEKAGGDVSTYQKLKKQKADKAARDSAPVHYQKDDAGQDTMRRDRKAGPKGHSAWNTFEKKGKAAAQDHPFASGKRKAPMSQKAINKAGIQGKTVTKDGQTMSADRWSTLKNALAKRKFNKSMSSIPDVN